MKLLKNKAIIYLFFFLMMLTSFSQYYISGRVPLCQSDATLIFGINKEHIDNLKNGKFNTWFPNYNLGINKSGADANTSPFSLPNIVSAFIPLDLARARLSDLRRRRSSGALAAVRAESGSSRRPRSPQ